ncbi:hypothetical protein [Burkholderia gladioli]|uniref:hypothetical protein n=1 Tax=Burkholderia gladioli TaxID=28095 RepID=UPI00163E9596|nr:hypothetical protein [Burkholderia gladioli]
MRYEIKDWNVAPLDAILQLIDRGGRPTLHRCIRANSPRANEPNALKFVPPAVNFREIWFQSAIGGCCNTCWLLSIFEEMEGIIGRNPALAREYGDISARAKLQRVDIYLDLR